MAGKRYKNSEPDIYRRLRKDSYGTNEDGKGGRVIQNISDNALDCMPDNCNIDCWISVYDGL